ncbi:hypothetical protein LUZ62_071605 [Rhynchospora pubera]|uniref:Uncharacterized protein n=1 Tax=Rhynchospora pubera TaxID=906938 RepID=A0AAV8D078_9POAL|nr:hypothetical protein LUZ62_071605 [Rhynchospora pubera]
MIVVIDERGIRMIVSSMMALGVGGKQGGEVMAEVLSKGRDSCYKARDAFYACLEKAADKKPSEVATGGLLFPSHCNHSRALYVSSCRPSWVRHFDRQYCAKKRVHRLLDSDDDDSRRGPMTLPQPSTFKT